MSKSKESGSSNILELRTVQSASFKILTEALREILNDVSIEFDESGMKIVTLDTNHVVLIHLKLDANKFEYFHCETKTVVGVNMLNLYKLIKTVNSNDTLTLFIDSADVNHLGIKIENGEKNTKTIYKLNLLDLDNQKVSIDPAEFNSVITLPSVDFQKIIRDMSNIAETVEIKNIGTQLILNCKGDFCQQETVLADNNDGVSKIMNKKEGDIVQGVFSLKYLSQFTKCTNLCTAVELYLKNDYPLIVKFAVSSLGSIKMALSPVYQNQ